MEPYTDNGYTSQEISDFNSLAVGVGAERTEWTDESAASFLSALADQISGLIRLAAETNASVMRTEATVTQLAEVLKQFSEVNPAELMSLLGGMMAK